MKIGLPDESGRGKGDGVDEKELRTGEGAIAGQVVEELRKVAFASFGDVAEVVDAENWLDGIPPEALAAVASVKVKPLSGGMERDIRMYDKLKALEMLAKIFGMYADDARSSEDVPVIVDDVPLPEEQA